MRRSIKRSSAGFACRASTRASAENAPFGADVRRALDTAMADLKRLGMVPRDVDGYCCDTEIGEGDEVIAVLSHLDVVPEGDGWDHDPYGAEIIDGRMIGRGTSDDKGPGVAAVFAMKAIMNAGIPLRRRCRLILGCDEECGMQDLVYYDRKSACRNAASPGRELPAD
ncbi:MAG: M20/M25/M40 family metallo-hydrolase [Christensenellales bacterium]